MECDKEIDGIFHLFINNLCSGLIPMNVPVGRKRKHVFGTQLIRVFFQ